MDEEWPTYGFQVKFCEKNLRESKKIDGGFEENQVENEKI